jgi:hypothetical protein
VIEVVGHPGSSEYEAACTIRDALVSLWPGIESTPKNKDHVIISAGVKISGYPVSDIDIVVSGTFHGGRTFVPTRVVKDRQGKRHRREPVKLENFVAVVEVKDHDQRNVQIVGDSVEVYYSRGASTGWHSATEQNDKQLHSLRFYFRDKGIERPWVYRTLVMRGLPVIDVPGALPRAFTGEEFLSSLASLKTVDKGIDGLSFSSGDSQDINRILTLPIFKAIIPTGLDRKRMDLLLRNSPQTSELAGLLGEKLVRLRGHGGTGKTVMLLQAAWQAYHNRDARTLVLTYNKALAADIRRLLALMGIPSNAGDGGIAVHTVMSFMYSWFKRLQLLDDDEVDSYDDYPEHCAAASEMLNAGAISAEDVESVMQAYPEKFDYDYVIVDESQDWPQGEADLLKALYTPVRIAIGDGVDQLLRGSRADWDRGVPAEQRHVISLSKSMRMKSNLTTFARAIAMESGLPSAPEPSDQGGGGQLYLADGNFEQHVALLETLTESAKAAGNAEIDFLFCVPPAAVSYGRDGKESDLAKVVIGQGLGAWDGVDPEARKDFPVDKRQYRIVQYESCRGLEGWVVVLDRLDEAWEYYRDKRIAEGLAPEEREAFLEIGDVAAAYAWNRVMIALCRPIDSLVITLSGNDNECARLMRKVANQYPEFLTTLS